MNKLPKILEDIMTQAHKICAYHITDKPGYELVLIINNDLKVLNSMFDNAARHDVNFTITDEIVNNKEASEALGDWTIDRLINELNDPYGNIPADNDLMKRAAKVLYALKYPKEPIPEKTDKEILSDAIKSCTPAWWATMHEKGDRTLIDLECVLKVMENKK